MNEQNGSEKKKGVPMPKEKKFYLFTAIGCALTLTGIILLAVLLPSKTVDDPTLNAPQNSVQEDENLEVNGDKDSTQDEPVVNTPEGMMMAPPKPAGVTSTA